MGQKKVREADLVDALSGKLSPLTTKGDMASHDGAQNTKVAIGTDGQVPVADAAEASGWKWGTAVGSGLLSFNFRGTTSTQTPPPANGRLMWNQVIQGDSTKLYVNVINDDGNNISNILNDAVTVGSTLYSFSASDSNLYQSWEVTGITDQTTYVEYDVTLIVNDHTFSNNEKMVLLLNIAGAGAQPTDLSGDQYFGEGAPYFSTGGYKILTSDSTASSVSDGSNLTDVSSNAADDINDIQFQGTSVNHTIIIGSTNKHWGYQIKMIVGAVFSSMTAHNIIVERRISPDEEWVEVGGMSVNTALHHSYANQHMIRDNTVEDLRLGIEDDGSWPLSMLGSDNLYWSRIRVVNTLSTNPTIRSIHLQPTNEHKNALALTAYNGLRRGRANHHWFSQIWGENGLEINWYEIGSGTEIQYEYSAAFSSNEGFACTFEIPKNMDTSIPITIRAKILHETAGNLNITWKTTLLGKRVAETLISPTDKSITPVERSVSASELKDTGTMLTDSETVNESSKPAKPYIIEHGPFDLSDFYPGDHVHMNFFTSSFVTGDYQFINSLYARYKTWTDQEGN